MGNSFSKRGPFFQDLKDTLPQWSVAVALVLVHSAITFYLPVPGCPTGYLGPGGLANYSQQIQCTSGAAQYIDRFLIDQKNMLPPEDLEMMPPVYKITKAFDPEGLLGTLTTCFLMALGMQASRIFIYFHNPMGRVIRLTFWSGLQLLLGGILCNFETHEGLIPPNRLLMSISYVLLVSGFAYLILLWLYLFINVWEIWTGIFFIYVGINMLAVLFGGVLFKHTVPFYWKIDDDLQGLNLLFLILALWNVLAWGCISFYLLRLGIVVPI